MESQSSHTRKGYVKNFTKKGGVVRDLNCIEYDYDDPDKSLGLILEDAVSFEIVGERIVNVSKIARSQVAANLQNK